MALAPSSEIFDPPITNTSSAVSFSRFFKPGVGYRRLEQTHLFEV